MVTPGTILLETIRLLSDPVALARMREAEESITAGDTTTEDEMAKLLADRIGRSVS